MSRPPRTGTLVPPAGWAADNGGASPGLTGRFLLLATLLGAALRVYDLAGPSLWADEMLTWLAIRPGVPAGFLEQIMDAIQGPLYLAVTWPLLRLADGAFMLRLPAALAGIATIPLFGAAVNRLLGGRAARLAVLLLAVNPFHVWYSQEGRGYSFLMLFAVLMALALLALMHRKSSYGAALLFALATAGAVWSNLGGMFLWAGMGLGVLLFQRPSGRREWGACILAFGAGLVLVAPWLLKAAGIWAIDRVVPGSGTGEALRGETTFSWLALPYTLQAFFYGFSLGPSLRELHQPDRIAALRPYLPLLLTGALPVALGLTAGVFRRDRKYGLLLVWILVPMAILTVLAVRNVKPWNPRYVAMAFPWVVAVAAGGLTSLPRRVGLPAALLLTGLTLWSLGGYYWDGRYAKADVRAAAAHLEGINTAGAPILVPVVASVFDYYYRGPGEVIPAWGVPVMRNAGDAAAFCDRILAGRPVCWVVLAREWYLDPEGLLPVALSRRGHLRLVMSAPGVRVYAWESKDNGRDPS